MTDLTTPAAGSIALPPAAAPPSTTAPNATKPEAFCKVMLDKEFRPGKKAPADDGERQDDAATGNDLPEKDKDLDPAIAWLLSAPAVPLPVPTPAPVATTTTEAPVTPGIAPTAAPNVPAASVAPDVAPEATGPQGICEVVLPKLGTFTPPLATPVDQPDATPQPIKLPLLRPRLPADRPDTASQPIQLPLLQPRLPTDRGAIPPPAAAASPVAAAALPALFALSMTTERTKSEDDPILSLTPGVTPLSQAVTATAIAPASDVQRQTLDLGRQDWPQKMIDHIEALRDNADANDTSIRLKPEALGRVDIALRTHDDGAISVRFTAEQPTTRTLLADATPQLSAAAEARGIRLSGTSVDLSGQGDPRPQSQADDRAQPITNRLATPRGDDNQAADDGRIA